jgi:hypothetical protein
MKYSFQKLTQFSQGNTVLDAAASNIDVFLERDMCFFNLAEQSYLEQNDHFFTLKTMIFRMYSCQKLTQLSQGNNVVHAAMSNIDCFLWRDTCASST